MAGTSGLSSGANGVAQLTLAHLTGGTALALTGALRVSFLSSVRTTNKELWYAPLTGGNKTVNAGDTCTIPSGSLTLNLG